MDLTIHENKQVLQQIEWDQITKKLESFSHFDITAPKILDEDLSDTERSFKYVQTQYFQELKYEGDYKIILIALQQISPDFSFEQAFLKIQKEYSIELLELNQIAKAIELYLDNVKAINNYFQQQVDIQDYHQFKRLITKDFLKVFRQIVSETGEITIENHPQIRPLYHEQLKLEQKIRESLNYTLNSNDYSSKIQFNSFDVIHERYVIPIKSSSFSHAMGSIVSRSDSGNTLYVEPKNISQSNEKRLDIIIQIQAIIARIEKDLTVALGKYHTELVSITHFIHFFDEFHTRVEFADSFDLSSPVISDGPLIKLDQAYHPLIEKPVKNSLEINSDHHGLIISGPNTGGKTATLKTIALSQLFLKHGLFIPAHNAHMHLYEKVFYFGNDGQDLTHGLSSFAAEVKNYTELYNQLGSSNLILIDEIFNSTSSEEASALAVAFFKKLQTKPNVHIVVSSHHQTLKTILHQDKNYISAHVGFDLETNSPTYKLHFGSPGSSQALNIFKSITSEQAEFENIYETALHFMDNQAIHYEKLLDSISQKENQLSKVLQENKEINIQIKNQKKAMDGVINLKVAEKVKLAEAKLKKITDKAEFLLRQVKRGEISNKRQLEKKIGDVQSDLIKHKIKEEKPVKDYSNLSIPKTIEAGKQYFCLPLEKTVTVNKVDQKNKLAFIGKGAFTMKMKFGTLRSANERQSIQTASDGYVKSRNSQIEYDCRGMRLEEFESLINDIISDLILGDLPYINIIHGHGTGVLKNWLRKFIKTQKELTIIASDSGNDGETRIGLKEN